MKIVLNCEYCGHPFERAAKEVKRNAKRGRAHYCSRACAGKSRSNAHFLNQTATQRQAHTERILQHCGNHRDAFTRLRYFIKVAKQRTQELDFDLEYLQKLWEEQHGQCPFTGWDLTLPQNVSGWENGLDIRNASLDRIDNSLGYIKGNVRFISVMANWALNKLEDEKLVEFCCAVADHQRKSARLT